MYNRHRVTTRAADNNINESDEGRIQHREDVEVDEETEELSYKSAGDQEHVTEELTSDEETECDGEHRANSEPRGHGNKSDRETSGAETDYEEDQVSRGRSRSSETTTDGETTGGETDHSSTRYHSNATDVKCREEKLENSEEYEVQSRYGESGNATDGETGGEETDSEDRSVSSRSQGYRYTTDEEVEAGETDNEEDVTTKYEGFRHPADGAASGEGIGRAEGPKHHLATGDKVNKSQGGDNSIVNCEYQGNVDEADGLMAESKTETDCKIGATELEIHNVVKKEQQNENNSALSDIEAGCKSQGGVNSTDEKITGEELETKKKNEVVESMLMPVIMVQEQRNENNSAQPDGDLDGKPQSDTNIAGGEKTGEDLTANDNAIVPEVIEDQNKENIAGGEKTGEDLTANDNAVVPEVTEDQHKENIAGGEKTGEDLTANDNAVVPEVTEDQNKENSQAHDADKQPLPFMDELKEHFVKEHIGSANQIIINLVGESGEHATIEIDKVHPDQEVTSHDVNEDIGQVLDQAAQRRKLLENLIVQQDELSESIFDMEERLNSYVDIRVPVMHYKPIFPTTPGNFARRHRPKSPTVVHVQHFPMDSMDKEAINLTPYDPYTEGPYAIQAVVEVEEVDDTNQDPKLVSLHNEMYGWLTKRKKNARVLPEIPKLKKSGKKDAPKHKTREKPHPAAHSPPPVEPMPELRNTVMYGWMLPRSRPGKDKVKKKSEIRRGLGKANTKHGAGTKTAEHPDEQPPDAKPISMTMYGWAITPLEHVIVTKSDARKSRNQIIILKERAPPPRHCWREEPPKPNKLQEFCDRRVEIPTLSTTALLRRRCTGMKCPRVRPLCTFRDQSDTCLPRKR